MRSLWFVFVVAAFIPLVSFAADSKSIIKAVAVSYTSPASGADMYVSYCAVCHGKSGKGAGPAAPALKVPPPDLTQLSRRNDGKFPEMMVYNSILGDEMTPAHGSKDMPIWGSVFRSMGTGREDQLRLRLENLTRYLESFQQ